MTNDIHIRTYRPGDLPALVTLFNEADEVDQLERATTLEAQKHQMTWPGYQPETDCFLAWQGDTLAGYADFFLRKGEPDGESIFYAWGLVHPAWRRQGLGRRLLETVYRRAGERLDEVEAGPVHFHCSTRDVEADRQALFESFGLEPVRYFVNMARPIDNGLPPAEMPAGYRLRPFDPARDVETVWRVDNLAFLDHWGFAGFPLDEFEHWIEQPHFRPKLWLLAEEEATGEVVGLGLNKIDPHWIAQTGRQEGYVDTLAVLREHRNKGLGTALLVHSLHALRDEGMAWAHLGADAENLTGAVRIYERVGFEVRRTSIVYRKVMREG